MILRIALYVKEGSKTWIIGSRFLNHMMGDKKKLFKFKEYDTGSINFVGGKVTSISGKGIISIYSKHKIDNVYYIKGLRHNILSVS